MNKIEKLIEQLCPNGVELKKLEDLFKISRGRVISKDTLRLKKGSYPVYSSQTARDGMIGSIGTYDYDGEYLTWTTDGANAGTIFYRDGKFSITNVCGLLRVKDYGMLHPKFAYYALAICMKGYVNYGMGNPKLMSNVVQKIKIPVPPLAIQEKIVEILDQFTQLETELKTELEARKAQYQFYRNQLLAFENKQVEWKILGTLAKIGDGLHGTPKYCLDGDYSFINGNNLVNGSVKYFESTKKVNELMYEKHGLKFFKKKTIFLSINGTIGSLAIYRDEKIVLGKSVAYFNITDNTLNPKFLYYYFQGNIARNYFESEKTGSTIKNLGLKALRTFEIPVPPLAEQERIVKILDQFDDLVNNISSGLPAEIKARRQQYEYYRAKLLTFKVMENH